MTTLAVPPSASAQVLCDHQREILARIDRGGLAICEAELRHKLRWNEARLGSLLDVLADLEASGLLESALHFRLTDRGRAELPADYHPPVRAGSGIPWASSRAAAGREVADARAAGRRSARRNEGRV